MYYVSLEIETTIDPNTIHDYDDKFATIGDFVAGGDRMTASKDGKWFFEIYEDISCGAEFVTLPIPLGETLNNIDPDTAAEVAYHIIHSIYEREHIHIGEYAFSRISTHITFTVDPKRNKPVPRKHVNTVIHNIILWYYPILYWTAKRINFPRTRSTYFRAYYKSPDGYMSDKTDYPAVFIPKYDYHGLKPFHKVEYRIPDTLFLSSQKDIAEIFDMYAKLMTNKFELVGDFTPAIAQIINEFAYMTMRSKGDVYDITKIALDEVDDYIIGEFLKVFNEVINDV